MQAIKSAYASCKPSASTSAWHQVQQTRLKPIAKGRRKAYNCMHTIFSDIAKEPYDLWSLTARTSTPSIGHIGTYRAGRPSGCTARGITRTCQGTRDFRTYECIRRDRLACIHASCMETTTSTIRSRSEPPKPLSELFGLQHLLDDISNKS